MLVSFELTMPNVGSWNGKWSQADKKFYIVKNLTNKFLKGKAHLVDLIVHQKDSWHYSWGDGWGANVTARVVDSATARAHRKASAGFAGYGWMVDSILWYGEIYASHERPKSESV